MKNQNYIYLLNKPKGITSFAALFGIKKELDKTTKVGHTGTLDPFATGLLLVLTGRATRFVQDFDFAKVYTGEFEVGYETDTLDLTGKVIGKIDKTLDLKKANQTIEKYLKSGFLQTPPIYSAKKINGKKACDLARQGELPILKSELKKIYSLELKQISPSTFTFTCKVEAGTYVRSLISELCKENSTLATLTKLNRVVVGEFTLPEIEPGKFIKMELFEWLKTKYDFIELSEFSTKLIENGATISFKHVDVKKDFIATKAGKPIALVKYISDKNEYKPRVI